MKLSEFPLLSQPSAGAVVPVVDNGANYTVLLNSLGSGGTSGGGGGYTPEIITLSSSTPFVEFTNLTGTEYHFESVVSVDTEGYITLILNNDSSSSKYEVQDFYSVNNTSASYRGISPIVDYCYLGGFTVGNLGIRQVIPSKVLIKNSGVWYSPSTLRITLLQQSRPLAQSSR